MIAIVISLTSLWIMCTADEFFYHPYNVTRSTRSGIAAYRSALTLDWLSAEDSRQRELVAAFETERGVPAKVIRSECIAYPRPGTGKIAKLMLELIKNLEGDDGVLVPNLIQILIRAKILVLETSIFESEPDLESLVKTPNIMLGEPHTTFPRILAILWMTVTDPITTKKEGWCPINKVSQYLAHARPADMAKNMRALDPVLARARFIMEEFIHHVTPLNILTRTSTIKVPTRKAISLPPKLTKFPKEGQTRSRTMNKVMRTHLQQMGVNKMTPPWNDEDQQSQRVFQLPYAGAKRRASDGCPSTCGKPTIWKCLLASILFIL